MNENTVKLERPAKVGVVLSIRELRKILRQANAASRKSYGAKIMLKSCIVLQSDLLNENYSAPNDNIGHISSVSLRVYCSL